MRDTPEVLSDHLLIKSQSQPQSQSILSYNLNTKSRFPDLIQLWFKALP